ncbi:MAG: hypothetical protein E7004_03755 [Alphaproteobacteria bacterium]|nr:hypothetical protein [Alphaproteobacteria bacterium]
MGIEDTLKKLGLKTNDPEEHLSLADNCDFNTYKNEFISEKDAPEKFVVKTVKETRSGYDIVMDNMAIPGINSPCFVPKECGIDMKEGMLVIFDSSRYVGANRSITFYSPQGELLGGYKDVKGAREIIKPNKKSGKECNAALKERIANKKINNEGELAPVWVDPNDPSKGRVPVSPLTRSLLAEIRERKKAIKAIKEDVAKPINNEGELAPVWVDPNDHSKGRVLALGTRSLLDKLRERKKDKNDRSGDERQSFASLVVKMAVAENRLKTPEERLAEDIECPVGRTEDVIAEVYETIDKMPPALRVLGRAMMDEGLPGFLVVSKLKDVRDIVLSQGADRDYYTKEKKVFYAPDMPAVECLEQLQKDGVLNENLAILKPEKFLESEIVTTAVGLHVAKIDLRNTPTMQKVRSLNGTGKSLSKESANNL